MEYLNNELWNQEISIYGWSKNAPHGVVGIASATNLNAKNYINIFYDTLTPRESSRIAHNLVEVIRMSLVSGLDRALGQHMQPQVDTGGDIEEVLLSRMPRVEKKNNAYSQHPPCLDIDGFVHRVRHLSLLQHPGAQPSFHWSRSQRASSTYHWHDRALVCSALRKQPPFNRVRPVVRIPRIAK
jgi:hypothetical protein